MSRVRSNVLDLPGQVLRRTEPRLVPETLPELQRHGLAAQLALEVQQERLGVEGLVPERGWSRR